jgi:hypothetical protein
MASPLLKDKIVMRFDRQLQLFSLELLLLGSGAPNLFLLS